MNTNTNTASVKVGDMLYEAWIIAVHGVAEAKILQHKVIGVAKTVRTLPVFAGVAITQESRRNSSDIGRSVFFTPAEAMAKAYVQRRKAAEDAMAAVRACERWGAANLTDAQCRELNWGVL